MPGSQLCGYVCRELQLKKLGCSGVHPARFTYFQWRLPLCVVLTYRLALAVYCIVWLVYTSKSVEVKLGGENIPIFAFLTMWTYFVLTLYLMLHCLWSILYSCHRGGSICERMSYENHRQMFHELQVQPSLWGSREYNEIPGGTSDDDFNLETQTFMVPWLAKLVWCLYNVASNASIMVTLIFWILLYPYLDLSDWEQFLINFQVHAVTSIIVAIEICFSAVPIHLPHYLFTLVYGLIYLVFSGIYYAVDHKHILYPNVLDWSKPGPTVVVAVVTAFVVLPVIQLFLFGIYKLRLYIFDKCNPELL